MAERKRGRAGQEDRKRRLGLYPVCAECLKRGLVKATAIIDHVVPLALGGPDTDENCQGLCRMCEAIKTAAENASAGGASNHPEWLKPSAIPLEIVCGPPFSGKSTYAARKAEERDTIIDLAAILGRLDPSYRAWSSPLDPEVFNRAIRVRNAMLGALSNAAEGRAFFILLAPTVGERRWWQGKLGGEVVLLDPGNDACVRRALAVGALAAVAGINAWRTNATASWSAPRVRLPKVGIGADGYPVGS